MRRVLLGVVLGGALLMLGGAAQAGDKTAWQLAKGEGRVAWTVGLGADPMALALSGDGRTFATATGRVIHVADAATGTRQWNVTVDGGFVRGLALSREAKSVVAGTRGGILRYDLVARKLAWRIDGHVSTSPGGREDKGAYDVVVSPDGELALSIDRGDPVLRSWKMADGAAGGTLDTGLEGLEHLALSPDGRRVALSTSKGDVLVAELPALKKVWQVSVRGIDAVLAFSPDGAVLAVGRSGGGAGVALLDAATGAETGTLAPAGDRGLSGIAWTPDGKQLVTVARGTGIAPVLLWTLGSPKADELERDLDASQDADRALVVGADGTRAIMGVDGDEIRAFKLR